MARGATSQKFCLVVVHLSCVPTHVFIPPATSPHRHNGAGNGSTKAVQSGNPGYPFMQTI